MDYTAHYDSPLGGITLASDGKRLAGLWFDDQKYFAEVLDKEHEEKPDIDVFDKTRRWLDEYFCGREPQFTPPLVFRGSDFRKRVWQRLMQIPYGHTETYGDIARSLGCHSAQAVGGAVGHNPLTLIAPCHRVMGSDGSLTGYAGGIDKKIRLLQLEGGKEPVEMTPGIVMSFKPWYWLRPSTTLRSVPRFSHPFSVCTASTSPPT